jgi:hypothetical protein
VIELEMFRGDDESFDIVVTKDGAPVDLTGAALTFTAKRRLSDADAAAVVQKDSTAGGIAIVDAAQGLARIDIAAGDTATLTSDERLAWDLQVLGADGKKRTLADGRLLIHADVTRA